eukprot:CAMPEP_0197624172 /NCGR_PEP_ID=MMETSP1338-20131121/3925_1 /TAXON_ID=43686 ORGANISM="Pelagodinium beii, Strain RCC1491" /NCGR_SAMPLE_ID=MMETSP1338 /ASSEMBLY_ACC=CAM_ASM_000754 /LENGTH=58 /DNA_ID=CAMNT_0043194275 /DNA_START=34 /DNA_END=210 /DNA_ORIENTATION=-
MQMPSKTLGFDFIKNKHLPYMGIMMLGHCHMAFKATDVARSFRTRGSSTTLHGSRATV